MDGIELGSWALMQAECLSLLRTVASGRPRSVQWALPVAVPVHSVRDPAGIVVRAAADGSVTRVRDGTVVTPGADDVDPVRHAGWSVTVVGQTRTAHDEVEIERLAGCRCCRGRSASATPSSSRSASSADGGSAHPAVPPGSARVAPRCVRVLSTAARSA